MIGETCQQATFQELGPTGSADLQVIAASAGGDTKFVPPTIPVDELEDEEEDEEDVADYELEDEPADLAEVDEYLGD